jgi:hypothetical protein
MYPQASPERMAGLLALLIECCLQRNGRGAIESERKLGFWRSLAFLRRRLSSVGEFD